MLLILVSLAMMEAVHVGAAMAAGVVLAHSTQMRKIIKNFDKLSQREIVTENHCYGCTAGAGSSCQGAVT